MRFIHQPGIGVRLGDYLREQLQDKRWNEFRAAIAFIKYTGVRYIERELSEFGERGKAKIIVGIDQRGTSYDGLVGLLNCVGENGEVWVFHNENQSTFHPKVYVFSNKDEAEIVVGSGNMTEGGLFTNYEASLALQLDFAEEDQRNLYRDVTRVLDGWQNTASGTAIRLDNDNLEQLLASRYIIREAELTRRIGRRISTDRESAETFFRPVGVPRPPSLPKVSIGPVDDLPEEAMDDEGVALIPIEPATQQEGNYIGFLMTLQRTDVGVGQTTAGTSRRSPEIFIPLSARNFDPSFWGWDQQFTPDPDKPGKMDRTGVRMRIGGQIIEVNMMTWPDKHDFRLRSEALRSAGNVGDILRIERADGRDGYAYYVEVIPRATTQYQYYFWYCANGVKNSQKRWGYY